jgi:hypothetical protein
MRRYALLAALVLAAAPAAAQQKQALQVEPDATPAVATVTTAPAESRTEPRTPTLYVSREQIDARLTEEALPSSQMTQRDFFYLAGAIALGIIVAALLLN